jgi:hypothetical protein
MHRATLLLAGLTVAAGLALLPRSVDGYAIEVHKDFYDHAFRGQGNDRHTTPPADESLEAFRAFVYERAKGNAEFASRWPTLESFDTAAFKDLLQLNPGKRVVGIDHVPAVRPTDVRTVVREGSVDPDNDHRNQDRFWLDGEQVQLDPYGRVIPYDPRTVWFGGTTGTPSQFDAHGATLRTGKKGAGIMTAFKSPEHFARPPVVLGSAPEFSETYTMLAMIAKLWGGQGSEWLALTFGGNNMHGLEDLGNQIHTTVVGTGKFFIDAQWTLFKGKVKRFFKKKKAGASEQGFAPPSGLTTAQVNEAMALIKAGRLEQVDKGVRWALGKEPKPSEGLTAIGIRIIGNHHRLLEDYVQGQYLAAMAQLRGGDQGQVPEHIMDVVRRARAGDRDFEADCRAALSQAGFGSTEAGDTPFAKVLAETMIEASAPEAEPLYVAIRAIAKKELRREGTYNDELGHETLDFVKTNDPENKHVKRIWKFTGRAFARVSTVLRLWEETFRAETEGVAPGSPEAIERAHRVIDRLVGAQLERLKAAEERRATYVAELQEQYREERGDEASGVTQALQGQ